MTIERLNFLKDCVNAVGHITLKEDEFLDLATFYENNQNNKDKEELIKKLYLDCNSLNCISIIPEYIKYRDMFLSIEGRIFKAIDFLK